MANTNVTVRIDETLKAQLQELLSNLGMDMTTFFTMVFFVKHFSLKKASEFPVFSKGFSLL